MCDAMLEQKIRAKVWSMVLNTETFTAFDVTKVLRNENPTMSLLHYEVRTVVHEMFNNDEFFDGGDYQRTLVKLKCGPNALVFHPDGLNPLDHPQADMPMSSALPCGPAVIDDGTNGQDRDDYTNSDDSDDVADSNAPKLVVYSADSRGRLCLRAKDLKSIGLEAGDWVAVEVSNTKILVAGKKYDHVMNSKILYLDKDGNLRLAPGNLTKGGFDGSPYEPHTIEVHNDHLIVHK